MTFLAMLYSADGVQVVRCHAQCDDDVVRNDDARPLGDDDVDPNDDEARNDGETIVNENDILMLEKLNEDADDEEEPPPPSDNEDDMIDSDDETDRERGYNSDDSYGF